jgi:hypothetical protein
MQIKVRRIVMAAPHASVAIDFEPLVNGIAKLSVEVAKRIDAMREESSKSPGMNVVKMFELQIALSELENTSTMSTSLVSALNSAIGSMARNLKG